MLQVAKYVVRNTTYTKSKVRAAMAM